MIKPAHILAPYSPQVVFNQVVSKLYLYVQESNKKRDKRPEVEETTSDVVEAEAKREEEDEQEAIERLRERMDQLHVDIKTVSSKLTQVYCYFCVTRLS